MSDFELLRLFSSAPKAILYFFGKPFRYRKSNDRGSVIEYRDPNHENHNRWDSNDENRYWDQKVGYYAARVFTAVGLVLLGFLFFFWLYTAPGFVTSLLMSVFMFFLFVDLLLLVARMFYVHTEIAKAEKSGTNLPVDVSKAWKND